MMCKINFSRSFLSRAKLVALTNNCINIGDLKKKIAADDDVLGKSLDLKTNTINETQLTQQLKKKTPLTKATS